MPNSVRVSRALLSVSDKTGVVEFARALKERGVELLSTGGTAKLLVQNGIAVKEVAEHTGFPEIMDGRVKTLHPKIHGGLLGRRGIDDGVMRQHGIESIDLLAVNLYPFAATVAQPGSRYEDAVENIDVGGPAMVRAAAKNHAFVAIVTDPAQYGWLLAELKSNQGATTLVTVPVTRVQASMTRARRLAGGRPAAPGKGFTGVLRSDHGQPTLAAAGLAFGLGSQQVFPNQFPGPMQSALDGPGRLTQTLGDLGDGELLEVAQQHDLQVMRGKRLERLGQIQAQGIVAAAEQLLLGQLVGQRVVPEHHPLQPPALAPDHHEEPGRERRGGPEPVELACDRQQRFLHGVVHVAGLAVPARIAPGIRLAHREEPGDRSRLAGLRRQDQLRMIDRRAHGQLPLSSLRPTIAHIGQ